MAERPIPLTASHSHLFRGARVGIERSSVRLPLGPAPVRVGFSDGVEVSAELLAHGDTLLLAMPSYRTSAGTVVDAALWPIAGVDDTTDAESLTVRLGARVV